MRNLNGEEISNEFGIKKKKLKFWQILLIVIIGLGFIGAFFDDSDGEISQRESRKNSNDTKYFVTL